MTPSSLLSFFSIRAAQEAQVIPPITSSTLRVSSSWSGVVVVMRFLSSCARSAAGLRQFKLATGQLATSWYSPASSRAASTSASVSALSAVTLTVEVPSTTRSICTSVTPGRALSSLVMAPTQCPQVSPVTGKVWVLMWFSLGWVLPVWSCVVRSGAADGSGAHQTRDRGRGFLQLVGRIVATGLDGVGDAVAQVLVEQGQRHGLQRLGGGGDLGQHVDAVRVLLDHAVHAPNLTLDPAQSPQVGILGGVVARRIGVHGRPPSQVPGGGIPHDRNHTPEGYIPQHPTGRMAGATTPTRGRMTPYDEAYGCAEGSWAAWLPASNWMVQCSTSKCPARHCWTSSSRLGRCPSWKHESSTTTWAVSTGSAVATWVACRSWTART